MAKDAHDDPYVIQGTPDIVLACTDCGDVGPIAGTRAPEVAPGRDPQEPLCPDCFGIHLRVWGDRRLHALGPLTMVDDHGSVGYRRTCPRCGGAGRVKGYEAYCFACSGFRWVHVFPKEVRRTARWSQTFQQNRTPR